MEEEKERKKERENKKKNYLSNAPPPPTEARDDMNEGVHSLEVLELGCNLYLALWMYLYVFVSFKVHRHSNKKLVRVWFESISEATEATRVFQKNVCNGAYLMSPEPPLTEMKTELEGVRKFFEDTGHAKFFELDTRPSTSSARRSASATASDDPYTYIDVIVGNPSDPSCFEGVPTIGTALSQVIQLAHCDGVLKTGDDASVFKGAYLYTDGDSGSDPWLAQMCFKPQDPSEARAKQEKEQRKETAERQKQPPQARLYKTGLCPSYNDHYKGRVAI